MTVGGLRTPEVDFSENAQIAYLGPERPIFAARKFLDTIVGRRLSRASATADRFFRMLLNRIFGSQNTNFELKKNLVLDWVSQRLLHASGPQHKFFRI